MKPSVLLAEDDHTIRMLLHHHLVTEGYRVVEASGGGCCLGYFGGKLAGFGDY